MKYPSTALFDLIKSLSKSEKRYLKLGTVDKQTEHLRLFEAILSQEKYDEALLLKQNTTAAFAKNIAVYKSYLYKYILNRLAQYHKKDKAAEIVEKIRFAGILAGRKLFHQAEKQLKAARKSSEQHVLPEMALLVIKAQIRLLSKSEKSNFKGIQHLYRVQKDILKTLELNTEYAILFSEISAIQIRAQKAGQPEEIKNLDAWRVHPLLKVAEKSLSLQNRILLLKSIAIYHFTKGEIQEASFCNKRLLDLLDTEVEYNKRHPEQYLSVLNNYIIDQLALKNIPAFETALRRLEQLPENPAFQKVNNIKVRIFHQRFLLFFNFCYSEKQFEKAIKKMPVFKLQLKQFDHQLKPHQRLTLYYLSAVLCFGAKKYSDAQTWLVPILQETREDVVLEIFRYARLLNLLVHLELGHSQYLDSLLTSTQRILSKQGKLKQAEKEIFQFLKKSNTAVTRKQQTQEKQLLKKRLSKLNRQPEEQRLFNYIPVLEWLEP